MRGIGRTWKTGPSDTSEFIPIPVLTEQMIRQHRDAPHMPLDMSRKARSIIINQVAAAHSQLKGSASKTRGGPVAG
jgi:pyrrolidone-carboxylate peptidase